MKSDFGELGKHFRRSITAFVFVILLLFPGSTSLICIAPGGHIAIESIGATCCASLETSTQAEGQPDNGLHSAGNCHNCTDFFIASHMLVAASKSYGHAAASPFADECLENHSSIDISPSLFQPAGSSNNDTPIPISSSVPMRC
jgi:hypothetical protein